MPRVREISASTTPRPAGPRCRCGTAIQHTPGKVPRVYCSDRCRKAAKRAIERGQTAAGGNPGHLGKGLAEFSKRTGTGPDQGKRAEKAAAAAIRRYQGRKVLNRESGIDACKGCGRRVLDPETGMIYARSSRGYVVTIGLVRCGRIWFCPECSAAIRRGRTEELKTGALRWLAAGGILAVVVLTARHNRTTDLADLSSALWGRPMLDDDGNPVLDRSDRPRRVPGAYQRMLTAPAFYGRPEAISWWERKDGSFGHSVRPAEDGIRHRIGYAGMARASEVTRSLANGWHPHMNLLAFLGGTVDGTPAKGDVVGYFTPTDEALQEWETWLRDFWTDTLRAMDPNFEPSRDCEIRDCKCEGKGHGVTVKIVRSADDKALIEYLTKVQDGKRPDSVTADLEAADGAVLETVRADTKTGRGRKSMTPFQILFRLWDLEREGLDPRRAEGYGTPEQLRAWWAEYEAAFAGRRAIEWTRGLRRHVQLDGDDSEERDKEFVYEGAAKEPLTGGVVLTAEAHGAVVAADAEQGLEEVVGAECYDSAADFVGGLLEGRRGHVRIATAEELAEVQENLYARLLTKRRKRELEARVLRLRGELHAALEALPDDAPAEAAATLQQNLFRQLAAMESDAQGAETAAAVKDEDAARIAKLLAQQASRTFAEHVHRARRRQLVAAEKTAQE